MQVHAVGLAARLFALVFGLFFADWIPSAAAQSSQVAAEWGLFNEILFIGIVVGLIVFGLLFYAIIRYREKPEKVSAK